MVFACSLRDFFRRDWRPGRESKLKPEFLDLFILSFAGGGGGFL